MAGTGAPKHGGTLTVGVNNEIAGWTPQQLKEANSGEDRGNFVYDTLLKLDAKGDWQPNLATSMTTSDSVTWTMKLRPGVTFTDGTPLDAAAVKFNVGLTKDPSLGSSQLATVSDIKAMNVVDPATVQFVLGGPDGSFPYAFTSLVGMMVSPTAYQADPRGFAQRPVGAGPFMLQSWTRDSQAVLVRNPHYWDVGRPYLDKVVFQVITDPVTLGQSLASGAVDVAANYPTVQAALRGTPGVRVVSTSLTGGAGIVPNESRAPFDDVRIRKAIALAIDPRAVNASLFQGAWSGSLPCAPYAPNLPECAQGLWPKTDLAEAKKLVADYVAEKGPLKDHYELLGLATYPDQAQFLQQTLAGIGIHVTLTVLQTADYVSRLSRQAYDLTWNGIQPFAGPARGYYRNLLSNVAGGRHMQGGPVDPTLENLLDQATKAVDKNSRVAAVKKIEQLDAAGFFYIWFGPYISGLIAKDEVQMPASFTSCGYTRAADIWLNR
ncbi:ABC transporter substrate-binding protein [Pseudofrankia sp. DC12]|uniref:ABC transporter substrate-binding protein n=1 Tax=Pseudofrankia sp. DC12 TaxID=683315 RepID=UPI000695C2B6|nr:ABC transporter substrate-binding protein [Pseudofrankia sp. DC12]